MIKLNFLISIYIINSIVILNAQKVDSCSVGIPHERFYLISFENYLNLKRFRNDFSNNRFHNNRESVLKEIDSALNALHDIRTSILSQGFYIYREFVNVNYIKDTSELIQTIKIRLIELERIKEKIKTDQRLRKKDVNILFDILFKMYTNQFNRQDWIQDTHFEFLNCLRNYLDTSNLINIESKTFIDSFVLKKRYRNHLFYKSVLSKGSLCTYNKTSEYLSFDIRTYYFPLFSEFYSPTDSCININQANLNWILNAMMNDFILIYVHQFY